MAEGEVTVRRMDWIRRILLVLLLAALGYATFVHLSARILPEDDAYIIYRYVENASRGNGLVYNVGERVFGISTPLYALWLLGLRTLWPSVSLPLLAVRTNLFWHVCTALALIVLVYRLVGCAAIAYCAGILAVFNPRMLDISLGGMEPFMFAALTLAGLAAMSVDRPRLSAVFIGMGAITRPEGLLVGLVWSAWWLLRGQRDVVALALAALPLLSWTIFASLYYGTPIPHSIIAKRAPLYLVSVPEACLALFIQIVGWHAPVRLTKSYLLPAAVIVAMESVGWSVRILLGRENRRSSSRWMPPMVAFLLISVLYCLPGMQLFPWYFPILWLLWLSVLLGAASSLLDGAHSWKRRVSAAALLIVAISPSVVCLIDTLTSKDPLPFETPYRVRVLAYQECAETINTMADANASVMASEIGALGYYYDGYIYDAGALVSPKALRYLPIPPDERLNSLTGAIRLAFVQDVKPDFIVALPVYTRWTLKGNPWFEMRYQLVTTVPLSREWKGAKGIEIWGRSATLSPVHQPGNTLTGP